MIIGQYTDTAVHAIELRYLTRQTYHACIDIPLYPLPVPNKFKHAFLANIKNSIMMQII